MDTELIINLWAYYDSESKMIYALAGRAYSLAGTDKEKLSLLKALSKTDYITAKKYEVPSRFVVTFPDGSEQKKVTFMSAVYDPNSQLFEEMFINIENELPLTSDTSATEYKETKQKLAMDPLCVTTVLYEDQLGLIRPLITEEDRAWITAQEA